MNYENRIDTDKLNEQLNRLKKEREKLNNQLESIKKETNNLKNYWETKTSNSVFSNFEELYDGFQEQIESFDGDIAFLESSIKNYNEYEEKANKQIDEKIAI